MAETDVIEPALETIKETVVDVLNETLANTTSTERTPSTPEGIAIAYGGLVFMALLPIFLGSFRLGIGIFFHIVGKLRDFLVTLSKHHLNFCTKVGEK